MICQQNPICQQNLISQHFFCEWKSDKSAQMKSSNYFSPDLSTLFFGKWKGDKSEDALY